MLTRLRSFWRRRIRLDVNSSALVLDVGSGDKPHWRADVFVDSFIDDSGSHQRSTGLNVPIVGPLFHADLSNLPFGDKVFDYVICSHVLEHVVDPIACIAEIVRVGKRGYVEIPFAGLQKIYDFPAHLWFCDKNADGVLIFTAKNTRQFDSQIQRLVSELGILSGLSRAIGKNPDAALIQVWWEGGLSARVKGSPNMELLNPDENVSEAISRRDIQLTYLAVRALCRLMFRHRLRTEPIRYNSVIKDGLHLEPDCVLQNKIYRPYE